MWLALFAVLLAPFFAVAQTTLGSLEGYVKNALTGAPVRKAQVSLTGAESDQVIGKVLSDTNGRFRFTGVPAGQYRLQVERSGFLPSTYGAQASNRRGKLISLAAGEARKDLALALELPAVISGRVWDENGEPLPGISIQALRQDYQTGQPRLTAVAAVTSNDLGEYRLYGLPKGKYFLSTGQSAILPPSLPEQIYPATFYPGSTDVLSATPIRVSAGSEARDLDFRLYKAASVALRGTVETASSAASLHSLQVILMREDGLLNIRQNGGNAAAAQFQFPRLASGKYLLTAWLPSAESLLYAQQEVDMGSVDINDVTLSLRPALQLSGQIVFSGSAPAEFPSKITVRLSQGNAPFPLPVASVKPDHSFSLSNLIPGSWQLSVSPLPPGAYLQSVSLGQREVSLDNVLLSSDTETPLRIMIGTEGATVSGSVRTLSEGSTEEATVLLYPVNRHLGLPRILTAKVGQNGQYQFTGIAPGRYRLVASEDIPQESLYDPDFAALLEGKSEVIDIAAQARITKNLTTLPLL